MTCSSRISKEAPLKTPFYFPKSRTVATHKGEVKEKTQDCQNQSRNAQNPLLKSEISFLPSINNKTSLFFAFKLGQDEKVKNKLCATCNVQRAEHCFGVKMKLQEVLTQIHSLDSFIK